MSGPSPRVRWLARVVCTLPLLLLLGDVGKAIPSAASEDPMRAFWMTQHDQGRQTLSLVTSRGNTVQCTFDYDTNTWTDTDPAEKPSQPPQEILAGLMKNSPCLEFHADHAYRLCIGSNATQVIGGVKKSSPLLLGKFETWKENGEQVYAGGSEEHCTSPRSFVVQFTCEKALRLITVTEPTTCNYQFVVGTPDACGHKIFAQSVQTKIETWYMELFESQGAISCVVHAAGFGLPSPVHSSIITNFTLKLERDQKPLKISSFLARHGERQGYEAAQVHANAGVFKPYKLPLPASPNYLSIVGA